MADALTVFLVNTAGFVLLWVLASSLLSYYVKKNTANEADKALYGRMTISYVTLAVVMMYVMWACCYLHHLNPLITPDLIKPIEEELLASGRDDLIS